MQRLHFVALGCMVAGAAVWLAIALPAAGEAWDVPAYWTTGLPLLAVAAGIAGYVLPARVWRWPVFIMVGQAIAIVAANPLAGLGLLPLAIVGVFFPLVIAFSLPAIIGAVIAHRGWNPEIFA